MPSETSREAKDGTRGTAWRCAADGAANCGPDGAYCCCGCALRAGACAAAAAAARAAAAALTAAARPSGCCGASGTASRDTAAVDKNQRVCAPAAAFALCTEKSQFLQSTARS